MYLYLCILIGVFVFVYFWVTTLELNCRGLCGLASVLLCRAPSPILHLPLFLQLFSISHYFSSVFFQLKLFFQLRLFRLKSGMDFWVVIVCLVLGAGSAQRRQNNGGKLKELWEWWANWKKDCWHHFDQRPLTRYQTKVDTGGVACDCGPVEARLRWKWGLWGIENQSL